MKTLFRISLAILLILQGQVLFGQNWQKVYNLQEFSEGDQIIEVDGGYIILETNTGIRSSRIFKIDQDGNFLWDRVLPYRNMFLASSLVGGFVSISEFSNEPKNVSFLQDISIRIAKMDSEGREQWNLIYKDTTGWQTYPYFIRQSPAGNYYFGGYSQSGTNYSKFIVKIDSTGNILWHINQNHINSGSLNFGIADNDNLIVFSKTTSGSGTLIKLNALGNTLWTTPTTAYPYFLLQGPSKNYYGYSNNIIYKFDSLGQELWNISTPINWLIVSNTEGLYAPFSGTQNYITTQGDTLQRLRAGIKKFDSSGNLLWSKFFHNTQPDSTESVGRSLIQSIDESILLAGQLKDGSSYNPLVIKTDSSAQNPLPIVRDTINQEVQSEWLAANNIRTIFNTDNVFFWDHSNRGQYHVPKDSATVTIFSAGMWIGGYDQGGQLHLGAQTYKQTGTDFWPGPLDSVGEILPTTKNTWDKIWKVNANQIAQHQADFADNNVINFPQSAIYEWPGKGNFYARGKDGTPLTIIQNAAPFMDINLNDIYEPNLGEYPDIKGDEMLWYVFNDAYGFHTETGGEKLKFEIQISAYGYNCPADDVLYNTIFINYKLINKSSLTYDSLYIAKWVDFDLGCFTDDFIGCDTVSSTFYIYNGTATDPDCQSEGYLNNPPIQTITFLDQQISNFVYYNNDFSVTGNPETAQHFYNYMKATWKDNTHVTEGGWPGHGGAIPTNFMFPGNPADSTQWSECSAGGFPSDRRGISSIGPFTFQPGEVFDMTLAFSTHFLPYQACPDFIPYRTRIDSIIHKFNNGLLSGCDTSIITCSDTTLGCVWPGDANNDGVADVFDMLPIGIAYDSTGPVRPNGNTSWTGQPMQDWPQAFMAVGGNYKHADCDGTGIIDSFDFQPILDNYGSVHLKRGGSRISGIPLFFDFPPGNYTAGSGISIPILLGTDSIQVADFYGMALRMNYNTSVVLPGSVTVDFDSSWVGTQQVNMKGLSKELSAIGRVDIGLTKINHTNSIGYGKIAVVNFILIDDIAGKGALKLTEMLDLNISEAKAISNDESEIELDIINSIENPSFLEKLLLYPNPTTGQLNIEIESKQIENFSMDIYNTLGQNIYHLEREQVAYFSETISLSNGAGSIYLVRMIVGNAVITKKVIVK